MSDSDANADAGMPELPTRPNPALRRLDRLVGTWDVTGEGITGQVAFAWMDGRFFFEQHVDVVHDGRPIKGIEYIGYDQESDSLTSHYFGNRAVPFEHTWEVDDDTLTIWFGGVGSPARFTGTFGADGTTNAAQ